MALKRTVSFMGFTPIDPPKLVLDEETHEKAEESKLQSSILRAHPYLPSNGSPRVSRCLSSYVPERSRRAQAKLPEPVAINERSVIQPPTSYESKCTNLFITPTEPSLDLDNNQGFSEALSNWVPCSWEGIMKLPIGTWLQYTSNVYPEYKLRKKIVCVIGVSPDLNYDSIHVWTPMSKDNKHHRPTTTEVEAKSCRAGYHLLDLDAPADGKFTMCLSCLCRGWKLTKGNEKVARIFYVSPWTIDRKTRQNLAHIN